jgi:hypothetical protein
MSTARAELKKNLVELIKTLKITDFFESKEWADIMKHLTLHYRRENREKWNSNMNVGVIQQKINMYQTRLKTLFVQLLEELEQEHVLPPKEPIS